MTPFEEAGYTKDNKFKVLKDYAKLKKGDILTLVVDNGSTMPWFKTEDGRRGEMYLPSMAPYVESEELEVYKEPKQLTPFERAGYTKDTKFKVLTKCESLKVGDIVTLFEDDGSKWPYFITEDGRKCAMYLPSTAAEEELEVYEEPNTTLQQRVETLEKELKQLKEGILNACTN